MNGIPAKGYKMVKLDEYKSSYKLDGKHLETSNYIVEFNDEYVITRLYDKINDREVLREGGRANYIEAFEDFPYSYDAWELSNYYTEKKYEINDVSSVEFIDEGARFGFSIKRKFYKSDFSQKIWFYDNSARIDFDTHADWHQEHIMVKAALILISIPIRQPTKFSSARLSARRIKTQAGMRRGLRSADISTWIFPITDTE